MVHISIYTTRFCGFCIAAKRLLDEVGYDFEEIPVDNRPDLRREIAERSGQRTVPQIFVDSKSLGGYRELLELFRNGELEQMLGEKPDDHSQEPE